MTQAITSMARRLSVGPLCGLFAVIHPFPAIMNATSAAVFYLMAQPARGPLGLPAIFLSVLFTHAAIGSLNDYCDVDLDRRTKPAKPIVAGRITARTALAVSSASAVLGLLLSAWFGSAALGIAVLVLAAGATYDLRLKGTVLSWLPYAIFIPALPVWAFVAAGRFTPLLLLSFPLGALIALALNLANTIPDIAGDQAHGIRGLAHRLGERRALRASWGAFAASIALIGVTPMIAGNDPRLLLPGLGIATLLLGMIIIDHTVHRSQTSLRRGWYLSAVLAAVIGIAWIISLPAD